MKSYVPANVRHLRRLLKGMPIGMLTTQTAGGVTHSRPMLTHQVDESGWLWFLTDRHSRKTWELGQNPHATIAFQSAKGDRFISVQGTAVVVRDPVKIRRLWNPTLRSWFPKGRNDPEIVLVAVRVERAEYWIVPRSRVARVFGALKGLVTGVRYEAGTHGFLDLYPALAHGL